MKIKDQQVPIPNSNPDPITGEPGCHPVGTGVGAAAGGAAGAATGVILGGPVGGAVGAVAGTIIGGLAGKATAEDVDPSFEENYWRQHYSTRPYYSTGDEYEVYAPAYQYGWEARSRYRNRQFDEVESELQKDWDGNGVRRMGWDKAKPIISDAWNRIE